MKKYLVTVGIDVSKVKLDVRFVFDPAGIEHPHIIVANNEKGIKEIIAFLKNKKVRVFRRLRTRVVQTLGLRC